MNDDDGVLWIRSLRKDAADTARTLRDIARGRHMDRPQTSGTDTLRAALRVRLHKGGAAILARDLNIGIASLELFATSSSKLPPDTLTALARIIFGANAFFDPADDLLKRTKTEAKPIGVAAPPAKPNPSVPRTAAPCTLVSTPLPPAPAKKPAGWAD